MELSKECKVSGIYCLTNLKTKKKYIGKSVNIQARYYAHIYESQNPNIKAYHFEISKALRDYPDDFVLDILEKCEGDLMFEREKHYINLFNTMVPNGYNMTPGGDCGPALKGESNGRAKLTEDDVIFIRTKLLEGYNFRQVYPIYEGIISERGMKHVWWGTSWCHVMPEIYEDRDKLFAHSKKGTKTGRRTFNQKEYDTIVELKNSGADRVETWQNLYSNRCPLETFNRYWYEYIAREEKIL